jgi:hypothetical protein
MSPTESDCTSQKRNGAPRRTRAAGTRFRKPRGLRFLVFVIVRSYPRSYARLAPLQAKNTPMDAPKPRQPQEGDFPKCG